jgi:Beta-ketoacyl synthase, N-terminal domain
LKTRALQPVQVMGISFWSTRLPGWDIARAVIRGEAAAPAVNSPRPAPTLLAPTERRRAPDSVALALEVAAKACEAAQIDPSALPSVFASTHGDLAISDYMCATLAATPTLISPIKFHNSVHNAAAGYWTIGTHCDAPYTAISAHHYTFAMGLLEALVQVSDEQRPVLYVAFDIEGKGPLQAMAQSEGLLGIGLVLQPARTASAGKRISAQLEFEVPVTAARTAAAQLVAQNSMAACFPLFEALALEQSAKVSLATGSNSRLTLELQQ